MEMNSPPLPPSCTCTYTQHLHIQCCCRISSLDDQLFKTGEDVVQCHLQLLYRTRFSCLWQLLLLKLSDHIHRCLISYKVSNYFNSNILILKSVLAMRKTCTTSVCISHEENLCHVCSRLLHVDM